MRNSTLLDAFRTEAAPPGDDVRAGARARLLAATEAPAPRRRGRRRRIMVAVAAGVAAAVLLLAAQPWEHGTDGAVARAAAAVSPTARTVVHLRAVGHGLRPSFELWQLGTRGPFRLESTGSGPTGTCTIESGFDPATRRETTWDGRSHSVRITLIPANQARNYAPLGIFTQVRHDLAAGMYREAGSTHIGSRTVLRLVPTSPPAGSRVVYYVDARTYAPVRWQLDRTRWYDFPTHEQLPATPANVALTSVQAQHPNAPTRHGLGTSGCRAR